jgi:hypothetical protein
MRERSRSEIVATVTVVLIQAATAVGFPWMAYRIWQDFGEWLWYEEWANAPLMRVLGAVLGAVSIFGWIANCWMIGKLVRSYLTSPPAPPGPPPHRLPPEPRPVPIASGPRRPSPLVARAVPPPPYDDDEDGVRRAY